MYKILYRMTTHERTPPPTSGKFMCSGRVNSSTINGLGITGIKCFRYIVMVIFIGMKNKTNTWIINTNLPQATDQTFKNVASSTPRLGMNSIKIN